jgi:hypothetical protein
MTRASSDAISRASYPLALPEATSRTQRALLALGRLWPVLLLVLALPFSLSSDTRVRWLMAGCVLLLFYACRPGINRMLLILGYLCLLGGLRRWLYPVLGYPALDPFLVVVPVFAGAQFLGKLYTRRLPMDTRLSRLILLLLLVMGLQVFNPQQGGLEVGLAGVMFYAVPLLWYFEARELASELNAEKLLRFITVVTLAGAAYATYQFFFGFTAGEEMWSTLSGAVKVGDYIKPMAFFTHPGEYVNFAGKVIVLLWAGWLCRKSGVGLLLIPLLFAAIFFVGGRGPLLATFGTCITIFAVQGPTVKTWIPRGMVAIVIAVVGAVWTLQQVDRQEFSDADTQFIVKHQTEGLLNPADPEKSTAGIHAAMAFAGIKRAFTSNPLGSGLGATTLAASKLGGNELMAEFDIGNVFYSLGLVGGTLYVMIVVSFLVTAFKYWHRSRSFAALGILGVLFISPGQWLNTGLYAQCMFIWVCVGLLDGLAHQKGLT